MKIAATLNGASGGSDELGYNQNIFRMNLQIGLIAAYAQGAIRLQNETIKITRVVHRGEIPILRIGFSTSSTQRLSNRSAMPVLAAF